MKLVHAADLHLDSPLRGLARYEGAPVERLRGATRRAFTRLIDLCLQERAAVLLVAGDIFDGDWRDYSTGLFFLAELGRLQEVGTRVVAVRGNHDAQSQMSRELPSPPELLVLPSLAPATQRLEALGVAVHGQSYDRPDVDRDLAREYPDALPGWLNIGLLHTALQGAHGHAPYAPCSLTTLAERGYQYWALGHVHQRAELSREPWVVFPGNLQGRHAREAGARGATLIEAEGTRITAVRAVALDVVRWAVVEARVDEARSPGDAAALAGHAVRAAAEAAEGRPLAARVRLVGATAAHAALGRDAEGLAQAVRAEVQRHTQGEAWVEKVELGTAPLTERARLGERDDAIGFLARAVAALRGDGAGLDELLPHLEELARALPREVREGADGFDPLGLAAREEALRWVEEGLLTEIEGGEAP